LKTRLVARILPGAIALLMLASPSFARKQDAGFLIRTVQIAGESRAFRQASGNAIVALGAVQQVDLDWTSVNQASLFCGLALPRH
jgi:hypothetical protein